MLKQVIQFEQHLVSMRTQHGNLRYTERTAHAYALMMDRAMVTGHPLAVLRAADTTAKWLLAMNAALAWADWKGDVELRRDACAIRNPGVGTKEVEPPTDEEWGKVIRAVDSLKDPGRSVLMILTTSGLRFGDVMHIQRTNAALALTNREITIYQKGDKLRKWAPGTDTRNAFKSLLAIPGWEKIRDLVDPLPSNVKASETKRDMAAYYQVRKLLHAACAIAGVDYVRPHRFRHAISEAARKRGMSPEARQKLLGHRDYRTTNLYYTHASAEEQIAVVDNVVSGLRNKKDRKNP